MNLYSSAQRVATNSDRAAESVPADLDPGVYPIISKHWFGVRPLRPVGPIAAEVIADVDRRRYAQQVHRLGAERAGIATDGDRA